MQGKFFDEGLDIPLRHIILPGTHDSATGTLTTQSVRQDLSLSKTLQSKTVPPVNMLKTQTSGLASQLAMGVRYFDLKIAFVQGTPYFRKGDVVWDTNVMSELTQVGQFLDSRYMEFVILRFSHIDMTTVAYGYEISTVMKFTQSVIEAIGQRRIATRDDNPMAQTYRTQCVDRQRTVMIIFDFNVKFPGRMPQQIHFSPGVLWTVNDPSVGTSYERLNTMGEATVNLFNAPNALSQFRNIHLHFQNKTQDFTPEDFLNLIILRVEPVDNMEIALKVIDFASRNLGIAIVTFDFYSADLTKLIVSANMKRVQLLQKMGVL